MILILYSEKDIAGRNIVGILREKFRNDDEVKVLGNDNVLYMNKLEETPEICIVASKHRSESGKPTLTCHSPGNFANAEFGGNPRELGIAPANYISECIRILKSNPVRGYEITLEVTHHGPTGLNFPIMFVEIGSTEKEWNDSLAYSTVAEVIFNLTTRISEGNCWLLESMNIFDCQIFPIKYSVGETRQLNILSNSKIKQEKLKFPQNINKNYSTLEEILLPVAIGFGGGHYCRKFTELTEEYAIGHICPKYNLQNVDNEIVQQMIKKTVPRPEFALMEKKGVTNKKRILEILKSTNLEIVEV